MLLFARVNALFYLLNSQWIIEFASLIAWIKSDIKRKKNKKIDRNVFIDIKTKWCNY